MSTVAITVLTVVLFWAAAGVATWILLSRVAHAPKEHWCCCGKFTLDDDDPLVTAITTHEEHRCQPRREAIR